MRWQRDEEVNQRVRGMLERPDGRGHSHRPYEVIAALRLQVWQLTHNSMDCPTRPGAALFGEKLQRGFIELLG